ncbi:MAG: UDP-N-acetylmuramoyl-L-alanyl-D-glutamate--2,6-diaminopimelate ligase, partial [Deltaproteobacteria bacterium]|nr:UDP-N-acetylmuramoyl-L-alanyl-D-glutamate--2,6-diaminopimelate ligase [Deltaproteobacteria bacterium]
MVLRELLDGVECIDVHVDLELEVSAVVCDSRKVVPGALFVALKGEKSDGHP